MGSLNQYPTSEMVQVLTPIWQKILQVPAIDIHDNFFDLGGESATAAQLFSAIAESCHRELPPVTIYQAPTIASLAALLEEVENPRFPTLVELKSGTRQPPIFITHGLGGTVIDFYQVVKHIHSRQPIHGMQMRGIDGIDEPFDRVEDMAQHYVEAVKNMQPDGPYYLVGFSLGGLVVLEMAQRLTANGDKVALLAMLDAYPHLRHLSVGRKIQLSLQRLRRRASKVLKLPFREGISQLSEPTDALSPNSEITYRQPANIPLTPAMKRVRDSAYIAIREYKPRYYPGRVRFVRAEIVTKFPEDPVAIWKRFVERIDVTTVPGDHLGIMTTHFQTLGEVLSRFIEDANAEP